MKKQLFVLILLLCSLIGAGQASCDVLSRTLTNLESSAGSEWRAFYDAATPHGVRAEDLLRRAGFPVSDPTDARLVALAEDLGDADFRLFINTPPVEGKVRAWGGLAERAAWIRTNQTLLQLLVGQNEEVLNAVNNFYANRFVQPALNRRVPSGPPPYTVLTTHPDPSKRVNVDFDELGFPVFDPHSPGSQYHARSSSLMGNAGTGSPHPDNDFANQWFIDNYGESNIQVLSDSGSPVLLKIEGEWQKYTWHHHQDGESMMPVLSDVHNNVQHSGGRAVIAEGIQNIFPSPQ